MNINFHYFVIKTLACAAGFSEEDAQTIAYYSQQVDDFTKSSPMQVRQEPPAYFMEKGYARELENGLWEVQPHPTGIDVLQSLEKHYRHTSLATFHFVPARPLAELEAEPDFTRADYRCVRADDESASLINFIMDEAVEAVRRHKCEQSLMQLGMAIHSYADTYAHCGYSGLEGWENSAFIKAAYNQMTGEEEVTSGERLAYWMLPHIGHANSGHVPDVCTYQIDVAMRKDEKDSGMTQHIIRDNLQEFLGCAKVIWEILCWAARTWGYRKVKWYELKERLAAAMKVPSSDETDVEKLVTHWSSVFPEIIYAYEKNERFYQRDEGISLGEKEISRKDDDISLKDEGVSIRDEGLSLRDEGIFSRDEEISHREKGISLKENGIYLGDEDISLRDKWDVRAQSSVQEELEALGDALGEALGITSVYDVTDAFYMYNELAYRRAELVLGTSKLTYGNESIKKDEVISEDEVIAKDKVISKEKIILKDEVMSEDEVKAWAVVKKDVYGGEREPKSDCDRLSLPGGWEPQTDLGLAVYTAGFYYLPQEDIICSTLNNVQRMGGFCRGYDEAAIAINSVIDCEPICFCYDGYEWMIELWKGQYGIETGCEIGVYYREQDKPLNIAEKTVLGKLYSCVPDERMLDLGFILRKNGRQLFTRGWERHWWLTGFHWGLLSEPEQLTMTVGIRFPTRKMQQAFVHQGLEEMGYSYCETGNCSVEFCFDRPVTKQPDAREKLRKSVQAMNREQVDAYNSFCRKYGITVNDPNVINQVINRQAGIREGKLFEKLVRHYNRKAEIKGEIRERIG